MVFPGGLHRKVLTGRKSETRVPALTPEAPVRRGRDYSIQEGWVKPSLGRIRVIAVSHQRLGDIQPESVKREGFDSKDEFEKHWAETYGDYDPNQPVWVIVFMLVDRLRDASEVLTLSTHATSRSEDSPTACNAGGEG